MKRIWSSLLFLVLIALAFGAFWVYAQFQALSRMM